MMAMEWVLINPDDGDDSNPLEVESFFLDSSFVSLLDLCSFIVCILMFNKLIMIEVGKAR